MDPVDEILSEILARPEPEWSPGLEEVCADRPAIAAELRRRFGMLARSGILQAPTPPVPGFGGCDPDHLGPYRLLRRLGSGGMGLVWLARDESLNRDVAIKMVRPERLFYSNARERFRREVETVARLRHHGCVQILHVGEHAEAPFFAMEYIRGASLDAILAWIRAQHPGVDPSRLGGAEARRALAARGEAVETGASELFAAPWNRFCVTAILAATEALAHAHARGVVHRDVKPSNLMLTPEGRIVVIDFGLALAQGSGSLTKEGSLMGSLAYMAPEQIRGDLDAVGPRTDVYGLGTCLYELLALEPAFPTKDEVSLRGDALTGKCVPVTRLNAAVGTDLAVVVQCAMHVDPERRYASALDFASDLVAVLHDRPIRARRDALTMRARRWSRKHPVLATLLVASIVAAFLIPTLVSFAIAEQRDRALLAEAFALRREYTANIAAARAAIFAGDGAAARRRLGACAPELRGFEWNHLALELDASLATIRIGSKPVVKVCIRDRAVAAADAEGRVVVTTLDDPRSVREVGRIDQTVVGLAFSADAKEVHVVDEGGTLSVLDAERGGVLRRRPRGSPTERIRLADVVGSILVEVSGERVQSIDPKTLVAGPETWIDGLAWSVGTEFRVSGSELAVSSTQGLSIWDAQSGSYLASSEGMHSSAILGASEGFGRIACSSQRGIVIWARAGGSTEIELHGAMPAAVLFPKDEKKVVVVSRTGVARVYDLGGKQPPRTLHGHDGAVTAEASIAGSNLLLTGGVDGTLRVWSTELVNHEDELTEIGEGKAIALGKDGDLLLGDDNASLFRVAPESGVATWNADQNHWVVAVAGGLRENLVVSARGRSLLLWGAERGETRGQIDLPEWTGTTTKLLVMPTGNEVVAGTLSGHVVRVDVVFGRVHEPRASHTEAVVALVWDATRGRVLSAGAEGTVEVHETDPERKSHRLFDAKRPLRALTVSGDSILSGEAPSVPARALLVERDARDGRLLRETTVSRTLTAIRALGAERVVTGSRGGTLTIWDRVHFEPMLELPLFALTLEDFVIGPGDAWIAAVGYGGAPKLLRSIAVRGPDAARLQAERLATASARAAAMSALGEEIWPPAARARLVADQSLEPEVRARALRMLPPANRWSIAATALRLATEAPRARRSRVELEKQRVRLVDALAAAAGGHDLMTRVALAMVLVRLELPRDVLATLAGLPTDATFQADPSLRSFLPQVYFARGSALLAAGERTRAEVELQQLRSLVKEQLTDDLEAMLLLRELEHALR